MKQLYVVCYYDYHGDKVVQCITDDFSKWLKKHNEDRVADGNEPENEEEFNVENVEFIQFNK